MKSNNVTISLEEYKELLLRQIPSENEKMLIAKIKDLILDSIKYYKDYNNKISIDFESDSTFTGDLITLFKLIDKDFYKEMFEKIINDEQKKEIDEANMKKLRDLKDIKKELED